MNTTESAIHYGNNILFTYYANFLRGMHIFGGELYATRHRLIFEPFPFHPQNGTVSVALDHIQSVCKNNICGIIPHGITITMKDGSNYRFILWNRKKVIQQIRSILHRLPS